MNAEFNWWLLIVGLVIGAGLTWLVLADSSRREVDIEERELESETGWIAEALADAGRPMDADRILEVLRLHRTYRTATPPDEIDEPWGTAETDRRSRPDPGERPPMAHPIAAEGGRPDRGAVQGPGSV